MANWSRDKKTRESIPWKVSNSRKLIQFSAMGFLLLISLMMVSPPAIAALQANVTVDSGSKIGTNYFSPGFVLDFEWKTWRDSTIRRQLSADANLEIMRICSNRIEPCTSWSDSSRTGTFNWANVDSLVQRIYEIGTQPLFTLAFCDYNGLALPPGMKLDPTTGLPYPASFAAYCREWVKHFKTTGYPVKYYEIINEAWYYFYPSWTWYETKASYFLQLFNTCYNAMHAENPSVMIGNDASLFSRFLNYWKANGGKLDILTFHKYDSWGISYPDTQGLDSADRKFFDPSYDGLHLTIAEARQLWGARLPAIATEANWGASHRDGTDPRIQQVIGAVWTALVLRGFILNGGDYLNYFTFSSSKLYAQTHLPQGYGFGMINEDDNKPWYPYYVLKMVGANLAVGDPIVASTSSSALIRTLAWTHQNKTNLLIISKTGDTTTLNVQGFQGQIAFQKVDNTISWETPSVQSGSIDSAAQITLKGYSVMLLQKENTVSATFQDGFESGSLSAWTGIQNTNGEAVIISTTAHHGTYSARFTSSGDGAYESVHCYKAFRSPEIFARGYFRVSQTGTVDNEDRSYFVILQASGNNVAFAGWRRTNGVVRWNLLIRDGSGWASAYSTSSPSVNQWYSVELHWVKGSTDGYAELYVDGTLVCSARNSNTASYGDVDQVRCGLPEVYNCGYTLVYSDCFVVSNKYNGPESSALFEDGFESGDFSAWSGGTVTSGETATPVNTLFHHGSYSARFVSSGNGGYEYAYRYKNLLASPGLYAAGYFYTSGSGIADNNDRFYFIRLRAGQNNVAYAGWRRVSGVVRWDLLIRDGSGWASAYSTSSPSVNQWYSVELHWVKGSTDGYAELYVNGVLACSIRGRNTAAFGDATQACFGLAELYSCNITTIYADCCEVSETRIGQEQ